MDTPDHDRLRELLTGQDEAALAAYLAGNLGVLVAQAAEERESAGEAAPASELAEALRRCEPDLEVDQAAAALFALRGGESFGRPFPPELTRAVVRGISLLREPAVRIAALEDLAEGHAADELWPLAAAVQAELLAELREARDKAGLVAALAVSLDLLASATETGSPGETGGFPGRMAAQAYELLDLCRWAAETGTVPAHLLIDDAHAAASCLDRTPERGAAVRYSEHVLAFHRRVMPPDTEAGLLDWITAVRAHLRRLDRLNRPDEALAASQRLLHDMEPLMAAGRVHAEPAADAHNRHATRMYEAGFRRTSLVFSERAVALAEGAPAHTLLAVLSDHVERLRGAGDGASARTASERVLELSRDQLAPDGENARINAYIRHSRISSDLGEHEDAIEAAERAAELEEAAHLRTSARQRSLRHALVNLIARLHEGGRDEEAVRYAYRVLAIAEEAVAIGEAQPFAVADGLDRLVRHLHYAGRQREALKASAREIAAWTEVLAAAEDDDAAVTATRARLANALTHQAIGLNHASRHEECLQAGERAIAVYETVVAELPGERYALANTHYNRHNAFSRLNQRFDALVSCRRAADLYEDLAHEDHEHMRLERGETYQALAVGLADERKEEALDYIERARDVFAELSAEDPDRYLDVMMRGLTNHVVCLERLGRSSRERLAVSEEVVVLAERLAVVDPDRGREDRAEAFINHAMYLDGVGRKHEAVEYAARAVEVDDSVDAGTRGRDLTCIASHLDKYAITLAHVGRHEEALEQSERAQALYDVLLKADRNRYLREVAAARSNHAGKLDDAGRIDDAVACSAEAVAMYEELDDTEARHPGGMATALDNHALYLIRAGRAADALAPSQRALRIREDRAGFGEPRFARDYAISLLNMTHTLSSAGEREAALAASVRALAYMEDLAATDHEAHLEVLAKIVHNHATHLDTHSRYDEAVEYACRAVRLRETLVEREGKVALPGLADSLLSHTQLLLRSGRGAEGADVAARRVEVVRLLTGGDASRFDELDGALRSQAHILRLAGRLPEAEAVVEEATRAWYSQADHPSQEYAAAAGAGWQASFRDDIGDRLRAAESSAEAVERTRRLVGEGHDGLRPKLAARGRSLAMYRLDAGDRLTAVDAAGAAAATARELAAEDADTHLPLLRDCLSALAWALYNAGRAEAAVEPGAESVELAEELDEPDDDHYDLADAVQVQAVCLAAVGRVEEALALADRVLPAWEALDIEEELAWALSGRAVWLATAGAGPAETLPLSERAVTILRGGYRSDLYNRELLAEALREHARHLHAGGRSEEARDAVAESIALREALAADGPARHTPDLAEALLTAADLGADDAVALTDRAVRLLGEAEDREPGVFTARLAEAERARTATEARRGWS